MRPAALSVGVGDACAADHHQGAARYEGTVSVGLVAADHSVIDPATRVCAARPPGPASDVRATLLTFFEWLISTICLSISSDIKCEQACMRSSAGCGQQKVLTPTRHPGNL